MKLARLGTTTSICAILALSSLAAVPTAQAASEGGTLDQTFNPGTGIGGTFSKNVGAVAVQPNRRIVIGGFFSDYNGTARNSIVRAMPDGAVDPSFDPGTGFNGQVIGLELTRGRKILVAGTFTEYNGVRQNDIARLNPNGSLDTSFKTGSGFTDQLTAFAQTRTGSVFVAGFFDFYKRYKTPGLIKLNRDGTVDRSFKALPVTIPGSVYSILPQSDGKIVLGGGFTSYGKAKRSGIVRLNADGSLDRSFNPRTGFSHGGIPFGVQTVVPTGRKYLVGGYFDSYNRQGANNLVRLKQNGTRDKSFTTFGSGLDGQVNKILRLSRKRYLAAGNFSEYNGVAQGGLAVFNRNGQLNSNFNAGEGFESFVVSAAKFGPRKVMAGGWFDSYQGVSRNGIARVIIS